jgi:hypothetical protein
VFFPATYKDRREQGGRERARNAAKEKFIYGLICRIINTKVCILIDILNFTGRGSINDRDDESNIKKDAPILGEFRTLNSKNNKEWQTIPRL